MSGENKKSQLKGSKENIRLAPCLLIFAVAAVAGSVIRTVQTFKFIDSKTGFYTGGEALAAILYIIIAVSILAFCAVSYLSSDNRKITLSGEKHKIAAIGALLFALSLLGDCYYSLHAAVLNAGTVGVGYTSAMKSGLIPLLIQSISALFSAVYLFILASDLSKGSAKAYKRKFLATAPVLWAGSRLIFRFLKQISFVQVSDLFLELCMIAFMIMFFMALAQTASGVYSDSLRWRIPAFGMSAGLIAAITSVPRMIVAITAREFVNSDYPFSLNDMIFVVFIITLVIKIKVDADRPGTVTAEGKSE